MRKVKFIAIGAVVALSLAGAYMLGMYSGKDRYEHKSNVEFLAQSVRISRLI